MIGHRSDRTKSIADLNRIASVKGRPGSQRHSRQASPAVGPVNGFNPQQTFQPPSQAGSFDFSFGGNHSTPSFGQQPPAQPQQNGGFSFGASTPAQPSIPVQQSNGGLFGSQTTASTLGFGASFGSNNTQSQQNGLAPSTSSMFGTQNSTTTAPTNTFSFGRSQPEPSAVSNGFQPSTSTAFGGQTNGSKGFTFGASKPTTQEEKSTTPAFGGFGASQPAARVTNPATPLFGAPFVPPPDQRASSAQPATPVMDSLGNGEKPKPTFSFGTTAAPAVPAPVNLGESIFSGVAAPSIKPGMFSHAKQNGESTPKPNNIFDFSSSAKDQAATPTQTPNPNNLFSFGQPAQSNGDKATASQDELSKTSNFFGGIGQETRQESPFKFNSSQAETPKESVNPFKGVGRQTNGPSSLKLGLFEDTNMQSPENTPRKPSLGQAESHPSMFSGFLGTPKPADSFNTEANASHSPATQSRSLWDRLDTREEPSTIPTPAFSFGTPAAKPDEGIELSTTQMEKSMFERMEQAVPPAAQQKTSTSFLSPSAAASVLHPPTFAPATKTPSAVPTVHATSPSSVMAASTALPSAERTQLKTVNLSLLELLKGADLGGDWSDLIFIYLAEVNKVKRSNTTVATPAPSARTTAKVVTQTSMDNDATPKASAFTNIFQTPAPSSNTSRSQPTQPPATAPVSKKRVAEDQLVKSSEAPATEKRARAHEPVDYPKLSENASQSAKLFESVLDKSTAVAPKFGPPDDIVNKVREDAAKKADTPKPSAFTPSTNSMFSAGIKSSAPEAGKSLDAPRVSFTLTSPSSSGAEKSVAAPKASFGGFAPSASPAAANTVEPHKFGFTPTTSDTTVAVPPPGMPAFSAAPAGSNGFLSSFGKKAEANAETEKKKRKAEDYDSEEDDEAEWEAKYQAEQTEKKRKIEETAKAGSTFGFRPSATNATTKPSASTFSFGQPNSADAEVEPKNVSAEQLEKEVGTGDNTWQPKTPIKFGTSLTAPQSTTPANPFGGLFGSGTQAPAGGKTDTGKLGPPAVGFSFGPKTPSLDLSRATTPGGATTDGEASTAGDGEPSDALNDTQAEDMTSLLPEERENNDVLLEVPICRVSKLMPKPNEDGGSPLGWVERGRGPMYMLREKKTGVTRVLFKIPPLGRVIMNHYLMGGKSEYKLAQGRSKQVIGPFAETVDGTNRASSWMMQVGDPNVAKEMVRHMQENRPKR